MATSDERQAEIELFRRAGELERNKADTKAIVRIAREKGQEDLAGMRETAMAALYSLMVHDDPGVRLKAVGLWMQKMIPTVASEKTEEESQIIDANVAGFDDITAQIDALKKRASE